MFLTLKMDRSHAKTWIPLTFFKRDTLQCGCHSHWEQTAGRWLPCWKWWEISTAPQLHPSPGGILVWVSVVWDQFLRCSLWDKYWCTSDVLIKGSQEKHDGRNMQDRGGVAVKQIWKFRQRRTKENFSCILQGNEGMRIVPQGLSLLRARDPSVPTSSPVGQIVPPHTWQGGKWEGQ